MRIRLEIQQHADLEAIEHKVLLYHRRIMVKLQFKLRERWSEHMRAIVDTGSAYSVIPRHLVPSLTAKGLFKTRMSGLVPEASLSAIMVQAECVATDGENASAPLPICALLTDNPEVPLILGLQGLLDQGAIYFSIPGEEAWLQFK